MRPSPTLACAALGLLLGTSRLPAQAAPSHPERDTLHILAVGDINFGRSIARDYLLSGRGDSVFAAVADGLAAADLTVVNLESLLLDRGPGYDPPGSLRFAGPHAAAALLFAAGVDVAGTANNHAWDFGRNGLDESLGHLDAAGLAHAGTGPSLDTAYRPVLLTRNGWTVAIFALTAVMNGVDSVFTEHPSSCCVAGTDTGLLAPRIRVARDSAGADLVLVMLHAGQEYADAPSRELTELMHSLVRAGADAVIGHHPHVPQGMEWYQGHPIIYSLGNFIFRQNRPWTDRGLCAELTIAPDGALSVVLLPVNADFLPHFSTGRDSASTMERVDSLTRAAGARATPSSW